MNGMYSYLCTQSINTHLCTWDTHTHTHNSLNTHFLSGISCIHIIPLCRHVESILLILTLCQLEWAKKQRVTPTTTKGSTIQFSKSCVVDLSKIYLKWMPRKLLYLVWNLHEMYKIASLQKLKSRSVLVLFYVWKKKKKSLIGHIMSHILKTSQEEFLIWRYLKNNEAWISYGDLPMGYEKCSHLAFCNKKSFFVETDIKTMIQLWTYEEITLLSLDDNWMK